MYFWYFLAILIPVLCIEVVIFVLYISIKAIINKNININLTRKTIIRFIAYNLLTTLLIIIISFGYNTYNSVGENEIGFPSQHEVKKITELLDENNLGYKVLIGKKIKLENSQDLPIVLDIIIDAGISFRL